MISLFEVVLEILSYLIQAAFSVLILKIYFSIFFVKAPSNLLDKIVWGIYLAWQVIVQKENVFPFYVNIFISVFLANTICCILYEGNFPVKCIFSFLINAIWMLAEVLIGYIFILCGIDYMIPRFWGALISKILTLILIVILRRYFHEESIRSLPQGCSVALLLMPIGSMYIIYNIFSLSVFEMNQYKISTSVVSSIVLLVVNIIVFKLYASMVKEKELQKYNAVYEQQIELCEQHMREKESVIMEFRKGKHDLKQHFSVLIKMLNNHNEEQALEYLKELVDMDGMDVLGTTRTENVIVDSLINVKQVLFLKYDIDFKCSIHIPMYLPFKGADISILLGNILDNAIEASCRIENNMRYIYLYMDFDGINLIITVINGYCGELIRDMQGKFKSSKEDLDNHGMGLESVKKIVNKYHGSVVIEPTENKFVIKVVICNLR